MLLRRIIAHLRKQEWTAIAIDFVIVVVGVFIGIQVANLNDERGAREREGLILERLAADFEAIEQSAEESVAYHQRTLDGLQTVVETLDRGALPADREASFRYGLRHAYMHQNATGRSGTFVEILSSGQVSLIRDEALRAALIAYDNSVQTSEQVMTQIRMHQSAHVAAFTIHYDYEISAEPADPETGLLPNQPVGSYDLSAMLTDRSFKNAAHEMRETNRYYHTWHRRNLNRARLVLQLLSGSEPATRP